MFLVAQFCMYQFKGKSHCPSTKQGEKKNATDHPDDAKVIADRERMAIGGGVLRWKPVCDTSCTFDFDLFPFFTFLLLFAHSRVLLAFVWPYSFPFPNCLGGAICSGCCQDPTNRPVKSSISRPQHCFWRIANAAHLIAMNRHYASPTGYGSYPRSPGAFSISTNRYVHECGTRIVSSYVAPDYHRRVDPPRSKAPLTQTLSVQLSTSITTCLPPSTPALATTHPSRWCLPRPCILHLPIMARRHPPDPVPGPP